MLPMGGLPEEAGWDVAPVYANDDHSIPKPFVMDDWLLSLQSPKQIKTVSVTQNAG